MSPCSVTSYPTAGLNILSLRASANMDASGRSPNRTGCFFRSHAATSRYSAAWRYGGPTLLSMSKSSSSLSSVTSLAPPTSLPLPKSKWLVPRCRGATPDFARRVLEEPLGVVPLNDLVDLVLLRLATYRATSTRVNAVTAAC